MKDIMKVDSNGFLSFNELNECYPSSISWLEYQGLIKAIPVRWKNVVNTGHACESYVHPYILLKGISKKAQIVYRKLVGNQTATVGPFN